MAEFAEMPVFITVTLPKGVASEGKPEQFSPELYFSNSAQSHRPFASHVELEPCCGDVREQNELQRQKSSASIRDLQ